MARKILACDDEPGVLQLVQVNLERAGYDVVTAADGREALDRIHTERPDLIILDIMMPYRDGLGVLQEIRRSPVTRDLPVILLTAKTATADVARGWQEGADMYLTKPFDPQELLLFVERVLSTVDEEAQAALDEATREATQ